MKKGTSFWRTLKSILPSKPKSELTSTTFKVNEEVISNNETIANGFGQFFSSIATTPYKGLRMEKTGELTKANNPKMFVSLGHTIRNLQMFEKILTYESTRNRRTSNKLFPMKFQNQWLSSSENIFHRV